MTRGVRLQYSFEAESQAESPAKAQTDASSDAAPSQRGGDVHNPLFDLLSALHEHGSIKHAATATGASYRHVWGALKHWQTVLGQPLVTWSQGQPARLTPFAERLLWAETRARARLTPHIEALRAELEHVLAAALDGSQQVLTIYASHDLALPALRERASAAHGLHIDLRFAGSLDALRALAAGRCTVAGFHVPAEVQAGSLFARQLKPLLKPGLHKLIGCSRRRQGLMVAPGNPLRLHTLADVVESGVRFVGRQAGSGTRLLLEHLLQQQGLDADRIHVSGGLAEDSHLAVAAAVASGAADAGLGIEAAALRFGLDFVPLTEEHYHLVCLRDALEEPPVQKLREVLHSADWATLVAALPGYAAAESGEVLSLTRALPWWRFKTAKSAPG